MNRFFTLLLFLVTYSIIYAQIQDEIVAIDDIVVYRDASYDSDSIYLLHKNEVALITENDKNNSDWYFIELTRSKLSKQLENNKDSYVYGFVPKSKIILVDSIPQETSNNSLILQFEIVKADTLKVTTKENVIYGLEIPLSISYTISSMLLKWNNKFINQNEVFFNDLYNIAFQEGVYSSNGNPNFTMHKLDDCFFVKQKCADGAGFYEITWVIIGGKIIQRLIDEI